MNNTLNFLKKTLKFGVTIPASNLLMTYGYRWLSEDTMRKIGNYRTVKIQRHLAPIIERLLPELPANREGTRPVVPIIWVCWLQGEENMPDITRLCLMSIRRNACGKKVVVITADNYSHYATIEPHIVKAFEAGKLKPAHFADIIRMNVLAQNGGLWLDATMYVAKPIDDDLFNYPFYSIKTPETGAFVSHCRWAVFCLGSWKGNVILSTVARAFAEYINHTTTFVDYFMFDQFIDILYQKDKAAREYIDSIPMNNEHTHGLNIAKKFDDDEWRGLLADTYLFKLSWRGYDMEQLRTDKGNFYHFLKTEVER